MTEEEINKLEEERKELMRRINYERIEERFGGYYAKIDLDTFEHMLAAIDRIQALLEDVKRYREALEEISEIMPRPERPTTGECLREAFRIARQALGGE